MQVYVVLQQKEFKYESIPLTTAVGVFADESAAVSYVDWHNLLHNKTDKLGVKIYYEYEALELKEIKDALA